MTYKGLIIAVIFSLAMGYSLFKIFTSKSSHWGLAALKLLIIGLVFAVVFYIWLMGNNIH